MTIADDYEALVQGICEDLLRDERIRVHHQKEYRRRSSGRMLRADVSFELEAPGARGIRFESARDLVQAISESMEQGADW